MVTQAGDLNRLAITEDHCYGARPLEDCQARSSNGRITVYFRNLEDRLIDEIRKADMVVGCVAWLTNEPILRALAAVNHGVSIVVQKEDFLRPDCMSVSDWTAYVRRMYDALPELPERHLFGGMVGNLSVCCDPTIHPVRCIGNHNRDKKPAFPRMHHKFLVFCDVRSGRHGRPKITPRATWTGSFNLTKNATLSLENAVVLTDPDIVEAYYSEWCQLLALSEPLDWESDWCAPQWRIGT